MDADRRTDHAKRLIRSLDYLTLATVDEHGHPWNCVLFHAYDGDGTFYWASQPDAQHSRNIAGDARGFVVIYDSTVEPYHGEAVFAQVRCAELDPTAIDAALALFHDRLGSSDLTVADVRPPAAHRLYQAVVSQAWIKDPARDLRLPVRLSARSPEAPDPVTPSSAA